jgi:aspartate-semialdehyde dehydrogenase
MPAKLEPHRKPKPTEQATLAERAIARIRLSGLVESRCYIAGEWVSGEDFAFVVDPATGQKLAPVARCGPEWIDRAVEAAARAFPDWRDKLAIERGALLRKWAELIRKHLNDLATLIVIEQGKPFAEAQSEISYGASFLEWFSAEGERAYGETIPSHKPGTMLSVVHQPVGVVVAITPWNFPCAMITRKAGAALAAGCPVIVKPAPETPLSALALAKLAQEAGIPGGVFQVVNGDAALLTERLLDHQVVRAVSFTGSTEVGRILLTKSAAHVRKISMELGGHAPFILFDDAFTAGAVAGCLTAKFTTSGQDCLAANRIYVQRTIYEDFLNAFGKACAALKVGHGLESGTNIGPMTRPSVVEKCRNHVTDALAKGARLVAGTADCAMGGNFVRPTVLADVSDDMLIAREETFGPIAAVLPFDNEAEVTCRANASEMGLAAYIYTTNLARAMRLAERLEYGMVSVNTASFTGAPIPFGGLKQSGLGREGSRHGLAEFMETKYVCFGNIAA